MLSLPPFAFFQDSVFTRHGRTKEQEGTPGSGGEVPKAPAPEQQRPVDDCRRWDSQGETEPRWQSEPSALSSAAVGSEVQPFRSHKILKIKCFQGQLDHHLQNLP